MCFVSCWVSHDHAITTTSLSRTLRRSVTRRPPSCEATSVRSEAARASGIQCSWQRAPTRALDARRSTPLSPLAHVHWWPCLRLVAVRRKVHGGQDAQRTQAAFVGAARSTGAHEQGPFLRSPFWRGLCLYHTQALHLLLVACALRVGLSAFPSLAMSHMPSAAKAPTPTK